VNSGVNSGAICMVSEQVNSFLTQHEKRAKSLIYIREAVNSRVLYDEGGLLGNPVHLFTRSLPKDAAEMVPMPLFFAGVGRGGGVCVRAVRYDRLKAIVKPETL
jgi:hypothetical protein